MDERARELFRGAPAPIAEACASDLMLDRRALRELDDAEAAAIEEHLDACPRCRARAAALTIAPAIDPNLRQKLLAPRTRRRWLRAGVPLALAASILLAFLALDPEGETRKKGGLSLTVYRERNGEVVRSSAGEIFHPGDRLRFEIDAPAGHFLIAGIDAEQHPYACVPLDGRARPIAERLEKALLPDAVKLDDSLGEERLVLIHCPHAFELGSLAVRERRVIAPSGCDTSELRFEKTR
jgi:hypothetical protein